jgi:hypothetical protein
MIMFRQPGRGPNPSRRYAPQLEALEDRNLLSTCGMDIPLSAEAVQFGDSAAVVRALTARDVAAPRGTSPVNAFAVALAPAETGLVPLLGNVNDDAAVASNTAWRYPIAIGEEIPT